MSRYIDAKELMRLLQNYRPFVESGRFNELQIQANQLVDCIEYEIEEAPSIDIVRCKECRWWIDNLTEDDTDEAYDSCRWDWSRKIPTADDFCSCGERRSDG